MEKNRNFSMLSFGISIGMICYMYAIFTIPIDKKKIKSKEVRNFLGHLGHLRQVFKKAF
jgi:4-hydroxy-L-threonine phosphate dehydrogenase PdxA